jgi:hypothetical protein
MTQSIIAYNDAKLKELEQKISDIKVDSKLPVKLMDHEGNIKKVLIEQSLEDSINSNTTVYFKFPFDSGYTGIATIVTINFEISYYNTTNNKLNFLEFKATISACDDFINAEIDMSLNHGKHIITDKNIVYYADTDPAQFYLKLTFLCDGNLVYSHIKYKDIAINTTFLPYFTFEYMLVPALPYETVYDQHSLKLTHSALDVVKNSNLSSIFVISNSTSSPGITHPHLYPDTDTSWTCIAEIQTGINVWIYTGP